MIIIDINHSAANHSALNSGIFRTTTHQLKNFWLYYVFIAILGSYDIFKEAFLDLKDKTVFELKSFLLPNQITDITDTHHLS